MAASEQAFITTFKAAIVANDFNLAWTIYNQQITDNANGTSVPKAGLSNFWTMVREHMTPAQRGYGSRG